MKFQSHLTVRHLRVVQTVGRELSLSRAAEILNTSQPAISRGLGEIEDLLGTRLFDRSTRHVSPTAMGRNLIWHAERILGDIDQAEADFTSLARGAGGGITIGVLRGFTPNLLARAIQLMHERAPGVEIIVHEGLADDLLADLMRNRFDVILSHLEVPKTERGLVVDTIYRESLGILAARRHPLTRRRRVSWHELAAQTWVLPRPGTTVRGAFDRLIQDNIGRSALSFVEVTSVHFGLALVLQSDMLAALPLHLVRWCAEDLKVASRIPIRQQSLDWPICATRMRARRASPAVLLFTDCIKAVAKQGDQFGNVDL